MKLQGDPYLPRELDPMRVQLDRLYRQIATEVNRLLGESIPLVIPSGGAYDPQVSRDGRWVQLDGAFSMSGIAINTWTTLFTLPEGYRPAKYQYYPSYIAAVPTASGQLRIQTNGQVQGLTTVSTSGNLILTGARFIAADAV